MYESAEQIVKRLLEEEPSEPATSDLKVENQGSLFLVWPMTDAGRDWLEKTAPEDAQFIAAAMVVEPRYVEGVVVAAREDGLTVS